jgi:protein-L-isoaspartate O-methyltransferase
MWAVVLHALLSQKPDCAVCAHVQYEGLDIYLRSSAFTVLPLCMHIHQPGHWTEDMRTEALVPAALNSRDLKVVDVGGGTGFTTLGIVKSVDPNNITLIDQSPHQLEKARAKPALKGVTILEVGQAAAVLCCFDACMQRHPLLSACLTCTPCMHEA